MFMLCQFMLLLAFRLSRYLMFFKSLSIYMQNFIKIVVQRFKRDSVTDIHTQLLHNIISMELWILL